MLVSRVPRKLATEVEDRGFEPLTGSSEPSTGGAVAPTPAEPLAHTLARESQECTRGTPSTSSLADPLDADLARLVALWPALEEAGRSLLVTTAETLAGQLHRKGARGPEET